LSEPRSFQNKERVRLARLLDDYNEEAKLLAFQLKTLNNQLLKTRFNI